jgi:hypothetical protein
MTLSDLADWPAHLSVTARSTEVGVAVEWPNRVDSARRQELSFAVRDFCEGIGELTTGEAPTVPKSHPHRCELRPPTPPRPQRLRVVQLLVATDIDIPTIREPSANDRLRRGAAVGPRPRSEGAGAEPGPLTVHAFRFGPEAAKHLGVQGPERPWSEFKQALVREAIRRAGQ